MVNNEVETKVQLQATVNKYVRFNAAIIYTLYLI